MAAYTQKLSIRLLREGLNPEDGLRDGVTLEDWGTIEGAKIALDSMGGNTPKWAEFLTLTPAEKGLLKDSTSYGLVFVEASGRWFAISFGMGYAKLDPAKFEQDFGLRVVMNAVDPDELRSADIHTPDENTLSRRSQTSRGSDQTAFGIDVERDIVRGLAGRPEDPNFALRLAGSDALTLDRKLVVTELPVVCAEAYAKYQEKKYIQKFGWIDHIRYVRDKETIAKLEEKLIEAMDRRLKGAPNEQLHLAFPVIYDPERAHRIRYKGFGSAMHYDELDLAGYLHALQEQGRSDYDGIDLRFHSVHEVDDSGHDCGRKWHISDCFVFETALDASIYVLSGGRWYRIDSKLSAEVKAFFAQIPLYTMPAALTEENEPEYNGRIAKLGGHLLCVDRKLIKPTGATSDMEVCDFLSLQKDLIHVKDKTSSSHLSHLFNQGAVSARVLNGCGGPRSVPSQDRGSGSRARAGGLPGPDAFWDGGVQPSRFHRRVCGHYHKRCTEAALLQPGFLPAGST